MDVACRQRHITVKKLDMNSPDFYEENMSLTPGTPDECWTAFWDFMAATVRFHKNNEVFYKPLRRDVVRKTCWTEIMKGEENAWELH